MLMANPQQPPKPPGKKRYILRDDLPQNPVCCACGSFCRVGSTVTSNSGSKIQYRYCKNINCGASHKVAITSEEPPVVDQQSE